jgi:hypothetical protein
MGRAGSISIRRPPRLTAEIERGTGELAAVPFEVVGRHRIDLVLEALRKPAAQISDPVPKPDAPPARIEVTLISIL